MVCSSFHFSELKKILKELENTLYKTLHIEIKTQNHKEQRKYICLKIEFLLRILDKYTDNVWFYEGFFLE